MNELISANASENQPSPLEVMVNSVTNAGDKFTATLEKDGQEVARISREISPKGKYDIIRAETPERNITDRTPRKKDGTPGRKVRYIMEK